MRDESRQRLSMAVVFHRPQSLRLWFSSRSLGKRSLGKKKDGHISSLSLDQLLKTKVAIRSTVVPAMEGWRDNTDYYDEEGEVNSHEAPDPLSHLAFVSQHPCRQ
jgi:hypothetical protein